MWIVQQETITLHSNKHIVFLFFLHALQIIQHLADKKKPVAGMWYRPIEL